MVVAWERAHVAASDLVDTHAGAARLADLSIATYEAHQIGLLATKGKPRIWTGRTLRELVPQLMLGDDLALQGPLRGWDVLAERAAAAGEFFRRSGGLDSWINASQKGRSDRKVLGAYATPDSLAREVSRSALGRKVRGTPPPRVLDPSVGYGSLLIQIYKQLARGASKDELRAIIYNLYGVEQDSSAREMCCILLWITAAAAEPELRRIAANIYLDNALTRNWWRDADAGIFDVIVMNPPWESLRHDVAKGSLQRRAREATLERVAKPIRTSADLPPLYSLQGTGDRNLYKLFVELVPHLLCPRGRFSLLIPAAFASDKGMAPLRRLYLEETEITRWTTFENRAQLFPIDSRYKFGILTGRRSVGGTRKVLIRSFAELPSEVRAPHVKLTRTVLERIGGETNSIPEITSKTDLEILSRAFAHGTLVFQEGPLGQVRYAREVDLSLGRDTFERSENVPGLTPEPGGTFRAADGSRLVPLLEGRMVGQYDFFQKSWSAGTGRTAVWEINNGRPLASCLPQFVIAPREVPSLTRVAICDVTAATNTRTVLASWVPERWQCGNTAPVLIFPSAEAAAAGLAILNSMVFDWLVRRTVSGLHLNKFYLEALVWPRLTDSDVQALAAAGWFLSRMKSRRFEEVAGSSRVHLHIQEDDPIAIHVAIESRVAKGYGLSEPMLRHIYNPDPTDRRGFWRYFNSEPDAARVVEGVLAILATG